jgi:predicted secreted Zn-dependent protease
VSISFQPDPTQVTWSNFATVQASLAPPAVANTAYRIGTSYASGSGGTLTSVTVTVRMVGPPAQGKRVDPDANSWVVPAGKTDDVLNHERLHYRIAAQCGRDLVTDIKALSSPKGADVDTLLNQWSRQAQTIENDYDDATQHGTLPNKQAEWVAKVAGWESANHVSWP